MPIKDLLFQSKYVVESVQQKRMDICNACPSLWKYTKTCKECGCFVKLKTKLKTEGCPDKPPKW